MSENTLVLKVDNIDKTIRIDKYIAENVKVLSRSNVKSLIDEDLILVNDEFIKPAYKVKLNDIIEILEMETSSTDIKPVKMDLNIVYEDSDLLVVNKKSGMVVHPAPGHYDDTLVNGLLYHFKSLSDINGSLRPGIIHRLDKDTSGLLMVAKNNYAHEILAEELHERKTKREYIALVKGLIKNKKGRINAPIGRDKANRLKMAVKSDGKKAITNFEVIEHYSNMSLIKCKLESGRTHQIRVHMQYINHPLINDELYGEKIDDYGQYLHAKTIGFTHPRTNKWMEFDSELPTEFQNYINKIKN
ncbi:MAG: RluA family pseudouridine synthase [Candidatus Izimaplasma sp.]|nr:RluA family pseudouridine synthase [Candidatus Izimaplasma bacterium]